MTDATSRDPIPAGVWLGLLTALAAGLATWSWGKWTDPHIDFGNELYLAWQITEGRDLYAEMAHRNGPFSHYLNALWFELFGVSLRTLVWCNLAILAAICGMIFRIVRVACGAPVAAAACAFQLAVFGFSQYGTLGNFNYVTPYQHFQTHGLAASLAMILLLVRAVEKRSVAGWAAAGVCLGVVFLGKVELFVPALLTAGFAIGRACVTRGAAAGVVALAAVAGGALLTVTSAFALLATQMEPAVAWKGVLGNWLHLGGMLAQDAFYVHGAGFEDVWGNLGRAVGSAVIVMAFAGAAAGADRLLPAVRDNGLARAFAGAAAFAVLLLPKWSWLPPGIGVITSAVAVALWWPPLRRRLWPTWNERWLGFGLFVVYAVAMLGKMLLRVRFAQYGFVLAMPAALVVLVSLVSLLPMALRARGGPTAGRLVAALGLGAALACSVWYLRVSDRAYSQMGQVVGEGADAVVSFRPERALRPTLLARTLVRLEERMGPEDTLLVLPEGIMLNYWLRRVNPTPYNLFLPTELEAFGEGEMLREIGRSPPDFIVLAHRLSREFGVGFFGKDPRNGRALLAWVRRHYEPVVRVGAEPFTGPHFGTEILERRSRLVD